MKAVVLSAEEYRVWPSRKASDSWVVSAAELAAVLVEEN